MIDFKKKLQEWVAVGKPEFNFDKYEGDYMNKVLLALGAAWRKVEATTGSFSNIPDGEYIGDLKEMKLAQSKKGRWQVEFTWEVADGEQEGRTQKQFYGISTNEGAPDPVGMGYFKGVTEVIGLDLPEDVNMWQETFDSFIAENSTILYEIAIKSNGNYANVYVNSVSESTKGEEGEEVGEEVVEVEEEVVEVEEEEDVQQVVAPVKKVIAKVVTRAAAAQPVAKPVVKLATLPKKVVTLARR